MRKRIAGILAVLCLTFNASGYLFAHCDTMDGPVAMDSRKALETNNVNYVLKWVLKIDEKEILEAFTIASKVKNSGAEAKELAERFFIETVVRVHRNGEGVAYTGVKPSGTPVDEKILAADNAIKIGNLKPLENHIPADRLPKLKELFDKVILLKNFSVDNVEEGREYVEAYVKFFHYAEGEKLEHSHHESH